MATLLMVSQAFGFILSAILFVVFTCWTFSAELESLVNAIPVDLEGAAFGVVGHLSLASESVLSHVEVSSVEAVKALAQAAYSEALGYSAAFDAAALSPEYLAAWERLERPSHPHDAEVMNDLTSYLLTLYPTDANRRPYHLN